MSNQQAEQNISEPGFWGRFGRRSLVHFLALLVMGLISGGMSKPSTPDNMSFGIYLGCICLFHRGVWHEPRWYVSSGVGIIQAVVLLITGIPLFAAIFWGGVQTWLQRLIQHSARMGFEWAIFPFLLMGSLDYFDKIPQLPFSLWPLWSMPLFALAGCAANMLFLRLQREKIHKQKLGSALQRLHDLSSGDAFSEDTRKQLAILLSQADVLERAGLHGTEAGRKLIIQIETTSLEVEKVAHPPKISRGGWSSELFRDKSWGKLAGKKKTLPLEDMLRQCNAAIMELLQSGDSVSVGQDAQMDPLAVFEQQARKLMYTAQQVPAQIAREVESIALLTFEIVKSMRDDPRDRLGGERFLQRYLPATEHIADEYTRLVASNNPREDVAQAISRGEEVLCRLHKAFKEELSAMLANDSASFTAELNALDKLLKMSGH